MTETNKIAGTAENWESRRLGADENYVRRVGDALRNKINSTTGPRQALTRQNGHSEAPSSK